MGAPEKKRVIALQAELRSLQALAQKHEEVVVGLEMREAQKMQQHVEERGLLDAELQASLRAHREDHHRWEEDACRGEDQRIALEESMAHEGALGRHSQEEQCSLRCELKECWQSLLESRRDCSVFRQRCQVAEEEVVLLKRDRDDLVHKLEVEQTLTAARVDELQKRISASQLC